MPHQPSALEGVYDEKVEAYAQFGNGLVAGLATELLPAGGSVLDVGCASGELLRLLADRAGFTAGLELAPKAAERAAEVADEVLQASIEEPEPPFPGRSFDLVVLADVLEHLVDPQAALERAANCLGPEGWVVVSVPNIAHWQARLTVLRGDWRADATGTFDASHLRFFNVARLEAALRDAGLRDVSVRPVVPRLSNYVRGWERLPASVNTRLESAWQRLGGRRPNLLGYQLVGSARR